MITRENDLSGTTSPAKKDESIFLVIAALLCLGGSAYYALGQWQHFDAGRTSGLPALVLGIAVVVMVNKHLIRQAALLICWGALLLVLNDSWHVGGLYSPSWALLPLALMYACWWLSVRAAIAMTATCLMAILLFHGLHHQGSIAGALPDIATVSSRLMVICISALALGLAIARHTQGEMQRLNVAYVQLNRLHQQQEAALLAAEQANSAKAIFLRNMSHELRTPLHAMLAFAHLGRARTGTESGPASAKTCHYFARITDSGQRLQSLLDDVLTITSLQSGFSLQGKQRVVLGELVHEAQAVWQTRHPERAPISVTLSNARVDVDGDPKLLTDVFVRLFDNAARYAAGSIISVNIDGVGTHSPEANRWVRCTVSDQGPGIPVSERERVFDTFTESSATASQAGGRGLGLAICASIIHAHGGAIHADEALGGGCAIVFQLPA